MSPSPEAAVVDQPRTSGNPKPGSSRILAIDDEPGFRALLAHELSRRGYQVETAENGEDGLKKLREGKFDLVISDIRMPKMTGMELLDVIKKERPNIEVIMATGFGTVETAVAAMKMGAYDFVQKPFNLPELFAVVEKALEKRELKAILGVYEASKAIFSSIKLDKLLPTIMNLAHTILRATDVCIFLKNTDGRLSLEASLGLNDAATRENRLAVAERIIGDGLRFSQPVLLTDPLSADERLADVPLGALRSSLVCPLEIEGEVLGVMTVNRTGLNDDFTSSDLCNVTIFGSQISQAVFNAKLYLELEEKVAELHRAYRKLEEAQSQLLQSEKLAAIGQLAAGVAHELNNPLTGILGFSEILLDTKDLPAQAREDIESIHKQSQRCRSIIQNLLQFSRRRAAQKEVLHLPQLIDSTLRLVQYDFHSSGIDIGTRYEAELPPVLGDANQLEQVILNLITNARQAMEGRKPARLTIEVRRKDDRLVVSINDTGTGIKKDHLGRIFDPFFTTKPVGKGTGLGLSISYGIVRQHNGAISVDSTEGVGTTFTVELPAHRP